MRRCTLRDRFANLAVEAGICCATAAAGGDCIHTVGPHEGTLTPGECQAEEARMDALAAKAAEKTAADAEGRRRYAAGLPTNYLPF